MKLANIVGEGRVNEASRLGHIYVLIDIAMQECIIYIHLGEGPAM